MIDVSQWRASIGLWNYCQAASSRPANGRHSHSFKAAVDSKSGSTTSGEKTSKLPAALSLIVSLLLSLLRYMKLNFIPQTGIITVTVMIHCLQSLVLFIATIGSSSDLIYYLVLLLLLLLSGDVELNPGPITGNPKDILRTHSDKLVHAISVNLYNVTDTLYAKELIPQQTKEEMHVLGITNNEKSSKLVNVIEQQLKSSLNPEQYLIDICHVLINQQHRTLTDIATSILHQLGQSIPDNVSSHAVLPSPVDDRPVRGATAATDTSTFGTIRDKIRTTFKRLPVDVQGYANNTKQHYKSQPIVNTDWPPKIGKNFFGRLALVEKQDSSTQAESTWHQLRGQVDKTVKLTENKEIEVKDVLRQPTDSSLSLRVVIDGPPGIGKTTLCRKLLNMWSNAKLKHQKYDLVLYCPLRNSKIATATTLADLFVRQRYEDPMVAEWFEKMNGEGLLIIFDGWDELSEQLRQSSLAASIIHRKQLDQCSVIVTSRSYASSLLLKMDTLSRHVQVIGFSKKEISTVIIQTLQKDTKLAQEIINENKTKYGYKSQFTTTQSSKDSQLAVKLINDLKVRNDVQSLCYVPLVCSMVILVYCKEGGHLPTTLTQLYENFILQTIRRYLYKYGIDPHTLGSLSSLPSQLAKPLQEMCQLAYTNLANTTMTFSSHQVQSLSEAVKEDYLGLMTRFTEYDEEKHQFIHLSIQEFLAAWWIAKHEKKREEVFKDHFDDDHFRMCLRFVAGLTHLEHESYQQYFNKQELDLQCKRKPLFGFKTCHLSYFYQNPEIKADHIRSDDSDNVPILLLQLLYESQNTTLCQVLAQSINNHSLCLDRVSSLFDCLCLSYCINNSNTTLHLKRVYEKLSPEHTILLQTQCKGLEVELYRPTEELIHKLLQSSLLYNIQECYCELSYRGQYVSCLVLLQFLNLSQLKILHLIMKQPIIPTVDNTYYTDKCTELEKCIETSTLQEMKIEYSGENEKTSTIISVIRGVTRNKTITSLTINIDYAYSFSLPFSHRKHEKGSLPETPRLPDGVIEQLLKDNNTLQALSLNIPDKLLPSSLNIVEEGVFSLIGRPIIDGCMQGYNGTIFAYGQTGSGKTFTMIGPSDEGSDGYIHEYRGVIPRSFEYLFSLINRERQKVLLRGYTNRRVAGTSMNRKSSRSHAVFMLSVESKLKEGDDEVCKIRSSKLNLIDLAGSERQRDTLTDGIRLKWYWYCWAGGVMKRRTGTEEREPVPTNEQILIFDRPIHKVRESLFSTGSGFVNYRGLLNNCIICL
uniref:NACHT domain-containing protein n=1 Tax=Amphimedon queenslandica TaxID=400682 RepID=A0A1X7TTC5_AMPQE